MENRTLNVSFMKGGSGSITTRLTLPKKWIDQMNISPEEKGVIASFDGKRIIIEKEESFMTQLYNGQKCDKENVLEMMMHVDDETIDDDMIEEEKEVIRQVASQNYEGAGEDLTYLVELLNRKNAIGFIHTEVNLQTVYDVLSQGEWYYMENEEKCN